MSIHVETVPCEHMRRDCDEQLGDPWTLCERGDRLAVAITNVEAEGNAVTVTQYRHV